MSTEDCSFKEDSIILSVYFNDDKTICPFPTEGTILRSPPWDVDEISYPPVMANGHQPLFIKNQLIFQYMTSNVPLNKYLRPPRHKILHLVVALIFWRWLFVAYESYIFSQGDMI